MQSIGERIRQIRLSKGMTQTDLATRLNTTKATISRYESSRRDFGIEHAQKIAEALDVPIQALVGPPDGQQVWILRDEKTASLVNGTIVYDWTDIPDGEKRSKMNEHLQHMADESERQPHTDVSPILIIQMPEVHQTNDIIEPKDLQQHYTASKQRNKRLDNLVKMFEQHPDDAQNRILEIISTFGRLTSAGQKQAVKRIKELAELTKYQAKQENDG